MKQLIKTAIAHPFISGGSIVITGGLIANILNFFFNLYMSRNLSVAEYGLLASIISLIGLPGVAASACVPIAMRFAGEFFAKGELDKVRGLYQKFNKFLIILSILFFISFLLLIPQIKLFFHIQNSAILLFANFIIALSSISTTNLAFIQAKMQFSYLTMMGILSSLVKLIFAILFVMLGFSALGGVAAIFLATLIPYIVSFFPLGFAFNKTIKIPHIDNKALFSFGIPSSLTYVALTSFISTDIILVKHFFSSDSAGIYAGLSLVGRVIFFLTAPLAGVMFPIVVQKFNKNENYTNTFLLSIILVLIPSICITIFYALFPKFVILFFLKNTHYLQGVPLLTFFALFITVYALLNIIANFYLSIKKTAIAYPLIIGAIGQVILISLFHKSYLQIIYISGGITLLLLIGFLLYYPYATRK